MNGTKMLVGVIVPALNANTFALASNVFQFQGGGEMLAPKTDAVMHAG